ncbi:MAG TPA: hypothetical protein VLN74_03280 [Ilumatobacteraceae bacterium]|nr:hypothetical protein [Ilumatobacteraceae bacterium]
MIALPLLRDSAPRRSKPAAKPALTVVPRRRRWPAVLVGLIWSLIFLGLLGAAVFHTQLAERQLELDRLDRQVSAERERFDELRYERAELRSPVRLAADASQLGMRRGRASTFVTVTPEAVARQLAAAGPIGDNAVRIVIHTDPLDQFRAVKSVTEATP